MAGRSVVVLGGGLAGMATAYLLQRAGFRDVTIVEQGAALGGLAATFEQNGHFYPLTYHHILKLDRTLLFFLDRIGALGDVRWRKIRMLFHLNGGLYDLARPADILRFPLSALDKLRFAHLMLRCFAKRDWDDWTDRSATELIDRWASRRVREVIFERLSRLKFNLPCDETSGAWLGARLHYREGAAPLGYIPGCNWTKVLCDGITAELEQRGIHTRLQTAVTGLEGAGGRIEAAQLSDGERIRADAFVSALPTETYLKLGPADATPELGAIRYTAVVSAICVSDRPVQPDFYWMNLATLDRAACGIFLLNSLNPTIGGPGESCVNFVTHVSSREHEFFRRSDETLLAGYRDDYRQVFGEDLRPKWTKVVRLGIYSPVFVRGYRNPPVRSTSWRNVYFAGNYRTFPSIASTGTALWSGLEAAQALLEDAGKTSGELEAVRAFRLRAMPRG